MITIKEQAFINYSTYESNKLLSFFSGNTRKKMFAQFVDMVKPSKNDLVLDVGVTPNNTLASSNFFEKLYPYTHNITMCTVEDASCLESEFKGARFVRNEAGKSLPFDDKQFDIVVCWAVLEHVGCHSEQKKFLLELLRVGKKVYLTTPNRWYPVELHTLLPFVHWLPRKAYCWVLHILGLDFFGDVNNLNLLTRRQLAEMLSPYPKGKLVLRLYYHWFLGFPSNIILYTEDI